MRDAQHLVGGPFVPRHRYRSCRTLERVTRLLQKHITGPRQPDATRQSVEQRNTDLTFEITNLSRQRRLRDA
jgi:hypothetical protein